MNLSLFLCFLESSVSQDTHKTHNQKRLYRKTLFFPEQATLSTIINPDTSMSVNNTPRIRSSLSKQTMLSPYGVENSDGEEDDRQNSMANSYQNDDNALSRIISANTDGGDNTTLPREPERKRKDNINNKIQELHDLIPRDFFADLGEKNTGTKDGKPNKGQILSKSVDYITWLQNEVDVRNRREVELALVLESIRGDEMPPRESNPGHTVAEVMLGKIGVGPLAEVWNLALLGLKNFIYT